MQSDPHLHPKLKETIAKGREQIVKADQDRIIIVSGREGSGKSTLASQMAWEFDKTFCLDDIVFNAEDFAKRVREVSKRKAVVFDEAFNGLSSKGALSKENKGLIRLLQECRQRNLFIIIVLPSIFLLEKYVAVFRSNYLVNTQINRRNPKNRFCQVYNYHNKKLLYIYGKKLMDYGRPKLKKKYNFSKKWPPTIVKEEYDAKKMKAFRESESRQVAEDSKILKRLGIVCHKLHEDHFIKYTTMEQWFLTAKVPLDPSTIGKYARKYGKSGAE